MLFFVFDCYQVLILCDIIVDTIGLLYLFFMMPNGGIITDKEVDMFVRGNTVRWNTIRERISFQERKNFFSGGWICNSGGTSYEVGVVREYCFSSSKRVENVICSFDDMANSGTL